MADLTNRSRLSVTVKNRDDLQRYFPFDRTDACKAYVQELREQGFKPVADQLDEHWLVRFRERGHKSMSATFGTLKEAEDFILQVTAERRRGLFVDYAASLKVTVAELCVRYLLDESPKHKSHSITAYTLEGWLEDSGPAGQKHLERYREELQSRGLQVRIPKFQMRKSSVELNWLHKPLASVTTVDIEAFINERLEVVEPSTVDREIDRLKDVFKIATTVWDYALAKNPMAAVRRPKYFNERDRRVAPGEETRLLRTLAQLDTERAVEARLGTLAQAELEEKEFTSVSARKKVLAACRAALRPLAERTAHVLPYLQVFYLFQVMTGARRGETVNLTWDRIDFEAKTAFLPETKNGRPRKLALRQDLLDLLRELPRDTDRIFAVGLDYLVGAWTKACNLGKIEDLHIHDLRHEAISRLAETGKFTLPELQVFSGHRDVRMLMRYAHLCATQLAGKLDECFKDETKVRVHRGRTFLNKVAGIDLAVMLDTTQDAPTTRCTTRVDVETSSKAPVSASGEAQRLGKNVIAFRTRTPS